MDALRPQALQISFRADAPAAGTDPANLKIRDHPWNVAHPEIIQREGAQHVIVVRRGGVTQIVVAHFVDYLLSDIEGGMGGHPAKLERIAPKLSTAPRAETAFGDVIAQHVE